MTLPTAPCPTCSNTIVFGERRCRSCGMPFDYGAAAPPEPSAAQIFDALSATRPPTGEAPAAPAGAARAAAIPPAATRQPAPLRPSTPSAAASMPGLDTGRFDVGDVEVPGVPGLIDSTLFALLTPTDVPTSPIPGLEVTHVEVGDAPRLAPIPGLEVRGGEVGDVVVAPVPGLFGSDLFRADVDSAAGAAAASAVLEVSPSAERVHIVKADERRRIVCAACSTPHSLPRCPACGTGVPSLD